MLGDQLVDRECLPPSVGLTAISGRRLPLGDVLLSIHW